MGFLKQRQVLTLFLLINLAGLAAGCGTGRGGPGEAATSLPDATLTSEASPTLTEAVEPTVPPTETPLTDPAVTSTAVPADQAAISVSPLRAAVGDVLTVRGEGFPTNSEVQLGFGRVNSEFDLIDKTRTDDNGQFQAELIIPEFVDPDDRWVVAAATEDLRIKAFSEELDILPSGQASFQVSPHEVQPGDQVQISGENLPENATVQLGIGRMHSEYDLVTSADIGPGGALEASFTIPDFVQPDGEWVIVLTADQEGVELFSEPLEITGDG